MSRAYVLAKAKMVKKMGARVYIVNDPVIDGDAVDDEDIAVLETGVDQLLDGKGFEKAFPLTGVGISGCNLLFRVFHFTLKEQGATGGEDGCFIDRLVYGHIVDEGREVVAFNSVSYK